MAKPANAPISNPGATDVVVVKLEAAPTQGEAPAISINAQESNYRPLMAGEVEALKRAASWEVKIAQVVGFVTIGWGLIGFFAPVESPITFGIIGLVPGVVGIMTGLAARQKFATANQAIASGKAVEFMGVAKSDVKNMRRIDFEGGHLRFTSQRIPKVLDEATRAGGAPLRVTFTEGGSETPAGDETMILGVNGAALPVPVLGQVEVG